MTDTHKLIKEYYQNLSEKTDWAKTIADDFTFHGIGGDTSKIHGTKGKHAYVETINRFYMVFSRVDIKDILVSDKAAYVTANYKLLNAKGEKMSFDIAELWQSNSDKLNSLTIFFDTKTWNDFFSK